MNVFRRLVFTAVLAGLLTGGLISLAHHFGTASIIARAEVFEKATGGAAASHSHATADAAPHQHAAAAGWEPQDGIERTAYTVLANVTTAIAFSLLLVAAFELRGGDVTWRTGLLWGLAGFVVFTLAPGLGLPPELPGTAAAPVAARKLWWLLTATATATATGLGLLLLQRRPALILAGVVLLAAPHVYGAPQPSKYGSTAPEELAYQFRVVAMVTSFVFWTLLGAAAGYFHALGSHPSPEPRMPGAASPRRGTSA